MGEAKKRTKAAKQTGANVSSSSRGTAQGKAGRRAQTSLLKNRDASGNKIGAGLSKLKGKLGASISNAKGDKAKRAEKRAEKKRQKAVDKIRLDQKASSDKIEGLFSKLRDPKLTETTQKKLLARVKNINTSKLTGTAAQDVQRLRDIAETPGLTETGQAQLDEQGLRQDARIEDIDQQSALGAQSAFEQLASRGGAGAGSRERQVAQGQKQALIEGQRTRRAGDIEAGGIRSDDAGRKLGIAGALPGQQLAVAGETRAGQQAAANVGLAKAAQQAQARQFDVSAQQQASQFKVGGQADALTTAQNQSQAFESSQLLSAAQRKAANKKQPGMGEKFDPSGSVSRVKGFLGG